MSHCSRVITKWKAHFDFDLVGHGLDWTMEKDSRWSVIRSFCQLARLAVPIIVDSIQSWRCIAFLASCMSCIFNTARWQTEGTLSCILRKWDSCVSSFLVHHIRSSGTVGLGFVWMKRVSTHGNHERAGLSSRFEVRSTLHSYGVVWE